MIHSTQKVIKIGSSGGVTIPAKEMKRNDIQFGDEVQITIEPVKKTDKHQGLLGEYEAFKKVYGETLKNLSDR
jgi:bifunctional DNA-binding transcriptional regulator/antitoxin component of YhaV-PrlF toxin-antitoxin module